ncbi:AaceriAEL064Cp [[Ashbya] aceris (nom. inval.)]|nr:AaceriAEL064Cp [[Ashbya] aceris (nom. inval.)]
MGASCNDQRKAVAICLQRSPCVMIERNTPKQCLEDPELRKQMPDLCIAQMRSFLECKRGMVDMTKRFRGNGAMSTGRYDQQYENLSSGNFSARAELQKLEELDESNKT